MQHRWASRVVAVSIDGRCRRMVFEGDIGRVDEQGYFYIVASKNI
jgi:hypothetical protein